MEIMAAMTEETGFNGTYAVQCALLHDVIEDTEVSYEQLHDEFGKAVADGVLALTKNKTSDKYSAMKDSIERIKKQSR
jgi:(p)ppGpp synthase/HD superfamily hydrolase